MTDDCCGDSSFQVGAGLVGLPRAWKADKQLVTLFSHLPLPDDGGRLVRYHFGEAAEMIWLMD